MVATGVLIGFAFLTKQLQALLVVPGFAVAYLVVAPGGWWRRVRHVLLGAGRRSSPAPGGGSPSSTLWPTGSRPYVGGSQTNSIFDLTFGYNGFGRLTGNEDGSVSRRPSGGLGARRASDRLVDGANGGQIAWLLPAVAGRRRRRAVVLAAARPARDRRAPCSWCSAVGSS